MLILWDIDQTLIEVSDLDRSVWSDVAGELLGVPPHPIEVIQGSTIGSIVSSALVQHGASQDVAQRLLPQALAAELAALEDGDRLRAGGRILPGAPEALARIAQLDPPIVQSILTGNQQEGARLKLGAFDLLTHLDIEAGAYGSDHDDRPSLVPIARARTAERYGTGREQPTVLIGDSVRDVDAARRNGAAAIAVCTGTTPAASLRDAGADVVLSGLEDTDALIDALHEVTGETLVDPPSPAARRRQH